jgi:DNA-binding CsgD family transcriptional regulator
MDRLAMADQRRLLSLNHEAQEAALLEPRAAAEFILDALSALVPSDCTVHRKMGAGLDRELVTATDARMQAAQEVGQDRWAAILTRGEHPVVAHWDRSGDDRAARLSDFVGSATLHRLEIYNEFWRPFSIERTMGAKVWLPMDQAIVLASYRSGSDFTERDRIVLDAVSFTVVQLGRRAEMRGLVAASVSTLGLTSREAEIIAWAAHGKTNNEIGEVLFLAPGTVKKHLDNIYRKLSIRTRTEAAGLALDAWWGTNTGALLSDLGGSTRAALGLTRREADVLALAGRGKTNVEIGAALAMSPGTAKHHLENIYRKFEVNSRTDATKLAMAAIRGHAATQA